MNNGYVTVKIYGVQSTDRYKHVLINAVYTMLKERFHYTDFTIKAISVMPANTGANRKANSLYVISYFDLHDMNGYGIHRCLISILDLDDNKMSVVGMYRVDSNKLEPLTLTRLDKVDEKDDTGSSS